MSGLHSQAAGTSRLEGCPGPRETWSCSRAKPQGAFDGDTERTCEGMVHDLMPARASLLRWGIAGHKRAETPGCRLQTGND